MDTLISPARYTLTASQVAAAMALAGIAPSAPNTASALPATPAPADPLAALRGTPALEGDAIATGLRTSLAVLADARRVTSIAANVAGDPTWTTSLISRGAAPEPYVAHPGGEDYDLAVLPTQTDAMLYADQLLSITEGYSQDGEPAVTLSLAGIAAFAALADALQRAKLQALLDRQPQYAATWSIADLESLLATGLAAEDTRWATTAVRHAAPVPLAGAAGALATGVAELVRLGLAAGDGDHVSLTPPGHTRALAFGQLVNVGSLTSVEADEAGDATAACVSIMRTVLGVWVITWTLAGASAEAVLEEVTAGRALALVGTIIG